MTNLDIERANGINAAADAAQARYESIAAAIEHKDVGQLSAALWDGYRYNMDGDRLVWVESLMHDNLLDADLLHKAAESNDGAKLRLEIDVGRAQQQALWKERGTQENVERALTSVGSTLNERQRVALSTLVGEGRISADRLTGLRDLGLAIGKRMGLHSRELRSNIDIPKEAITLAGERIAVARDERAQKLEQFATLDSFKRHFDNIGIAPAVFLPDWIENEQDPVVKDAMKRIAAQLGHKPEQTLRPEIAAPAQEQAKPLDGVAIKRLDGNGEVIVHDRAEARAYRLAGTIGPLSPEDNLAVQTAEARRNIAAAKPGEPGYMTEGDLAIIRAEHEQGHEYVAESLNKAIDYLHAEKIAPGQYKYEDRDLTGEPVAYVVNTGSLLSLSEYLEDKGDHGYTLWRDERAQQTLKEWSEEQTLTIGDQLAEEQKLTHDDDSTPPL